MRSVVVGDDSRGFATVDPSGRQNRFEPNQSFLTMSYFIAAISNSGGAPEQAYRKMQAAGACPEKPFAGKFSSRIFSHTPRCCALLRRMGMTS